MTLLRFPRTGLDRAGDRYIIDRPLGTHWRPATCREVRCPDHVNGWQTYVPAVGPQADYIRHSSQRSFTESRAGDGTACFTFPPGQRCFRSHVHRLPLEREPVFRQGQGRGGLVTQDFDEWRDHYNDHATRINQARKEG